MSRNELAGCSYDRQESVLEASTIGLYELSGNRPAQLIADVNPRLHDYASVHFEHELGRTM